MHDHWLFKTRTSLCMDHASKWVSDFSPTTEQFYTKPLKRYSSLLWFCELIITPFFSLYLPRNDICFLSQLTQPWYDSVIANLSSLKIQHNPDLVLVCGPLYPQRILQNYFIRKHEWQSWKSIIFTITLYCFLYSSDYFLAVISGKKPPQT